MEFQVIVKLMAPFIVQLSTIKLIQYLTVLGEAKNPILGQSESCADMRPARDDGYYPT